MGTTYRPVGKVNCQYGAPMGRPAKLPDHDPEGSIKLHIRQLPLSDGYDRGGAYWGWPNNLWHVISTDGEVEMFYRGNSYEDVRRKAKEDLSRYTQVRFFR